ncbi:MAG: hypothetical protein EZS28_026672 [Streblomastix strix]|uniref:Uncharacterized protein n=1 Tax=Streblomastix strix TaxID=222440 RepID=A0A5J4V6M0_9EUKA|nr:MAG: hypothetical protein EZS28_026672 [Streblomastix strix]
MKTIRGWFAAFSRSAYPNKEDELLHYMDCFLEGYQQHLGNELIFLCSIAPPLYYETAILGRRDWMLLRAVCPYGHEVDLPVVQLDLDVFQSDRRLESTVDTNTLIQRTTPLPLVQRQLVQVLEGINGAQIQETDFYSTNMANTQVLQVMQRDARALQLLQHAEISAADRQLLPPLQTIDALASGFQLQALEFWELCLLSIQHILEISLTEALIDTVSELALAIRWKQQLSDEPLQPSDNVEITDQHLVTNHRDKSPQRRAMLTPAQITNNLLLGINTKSQQQTQQSQISQIPSQVPFQAKFHQNLQSQQQLQSLNGGLFNTATQPQLNLQNSIPPDSSLNRQQKIASILPIIQNPKQYGSDSESNQIQKQNTIARNFHTVMEIDKESDGHDINLSPLDAKINQALFNRQRDYWATKSYVLKYTSKPRTGQHHSGYEEGRNDVRKVILKHEKGEIVSIADLRKFCNELFTDLKLDDVRLQSPDSDSEKQSKEKDQSTAFWNNPRKRYRQDDRSKSGANNQNFQTRYNVRDEFISEGRGQRGGRVDYGGRGSRRNRSGHNRDNRAVDTYNNNNHNLFSVASWPPAQPVPATASNTVVPDLSQRQIGGPTPQFVRTPDSWKSNKTLTPKYQQKQHTPSQSTPETASSNIMPILTPSVHYVQQEYVHFLHPPVAASPSPIQSYQFWVPPTIDTQHNDMIQTVNYILRTSVTSQTSRSSQLLVKSYYITNSDGSQSRIRSLKTSQLNDTTIEQDQRKVLDPYAAKGTEQNSEILNGWNAYEFGSLNQIPSQDQQEYSNNSDDNRIQRDEDYNSNDDAKVRSLSQKSLDRGAGRLEQPMGLQIPAPNLLVQNRSLVGVTLILDQEWAKIWNR